MGQMTQQLQASPAHMFRRSLSHCARLNEWYCITAEEMRIQKRNQHTTGQTEGALKPKGKFVLMRWQHLQREQQQV